MTFFDLSGEQLTGYRSAVTAPADFDAFWRETLEEARGMPLEAVFVPYDAGLPAFEVFDVTFRGFGGHRVRGWYIAPRGAKADRGSLVKFIGYNGGRGFAHEHLLWPSTGRPLLVMDTRGQGGGWAVGHTEDPVGSAPSQAGFMTKGIADPKTYFYRRVMTDTVRALDAIRTRAETDPERIGVVGGSQGGGLAIAAGGLDTSVKAVLTDVPFLSDFPRAIGLAPGEPYSEISRYLSVHRDMVGPALETLRYFDAVNLGARAKAAALFSVGLMDTTCPPSTIYAAFNAYGGRKEIRSYSYNGHEGGGPFQEREQLRWADTNL